MSPQIRIRRHPHLSVCVYGSAINHGFLTDWDDDFDVMFGRALALRPRSAGLLVRNDEARGEAGNLPGAEAAYRQALTGQFPPWDLECRLAVVTARQGRTAETLTWFEAAFSKGFNGLGVVNQAKEFDSLRRHPRYRELMARYGSSRSGSIPPQGSPP